MNEKMTISQEIEKLEAMKTETVAKLATVGYTLDDLFSEQSIGEAAEQFKIRYKQMDHLYTALRRGVLGEQLAWRSLRVLSHKAKIFRNLKTPACDPENSTEHDLVVLSAKGIFTIEVKHIRSHRICITEQGVLLTTDKNGRMHAKTNLIQQLRYHRNSLCHLLKDTRFANLPVYSVVMFTNDLAEVNNAYVGEGYRNFTRFCTRNDVERILFDDRQRDVMTENDMEELGALLQKADGQYAPRTFELGLDTEEYYRCLNAFLRSKLHRYVWTNLMKTLRGSRAAALNV